MTAPTVCPHCGGSLPCDASPSSSQDDGPRDDRGELPTSRPLDGAEGPAGLSLAESLAHPDPIAEAALASSDDGLPPGPAGRAAMALPPGLDLDAGATRLRGPGRDVSSGGRPAGTSDGVSSSGASESVEFSAHPRSAWPVALLASYASAMTIACGWLWWKPRQDPARPAQPMGWFSGVEADADDDWGAEALDALDPGRRSSASTAVEPAEPIAEDRTVALGESLRIDALEVLPLKVAVGSVELRRTRVDGRVERRDGGSNALKLHLRLRNTSDDVVFAPLDEAFVREPDRRLPETFIQDPSGSRVYAYRLPISSEWEVAGQVFEELRPGETIETVVLADTVGTAHLDGPMTWRLRLRTAPETTAIIGVSFDEEDVETAY